MRKLEAQVRGLVGASALFVTAVARNHFSHHAALDLAMTSAYRPAYVEFTDPKERSPGSADADEVAFRFRPNRQTPPPPACHACSHGFRSHLRRRQLSRKSRRR